jgi:uncharacterized protein YkwD
MTLKFQPFFFRIVLMTFGLVIFSAENSRAKTAPSPYGEKPVNNSFVHGSSLKKYVKKKQRQRKVVETNISPNAISSGSLEKSSCTDVMAAVECQVFALTNKARESKHLKRLKFFKNCYQSAQAHSVYMAMMSNTGQSLSRSVNHDKFKERMKKFDVGGSRVTENVAGGRFKKMDELFNNWMKSAEHRANILDPKATSMAVSMVEDKDGVQFWTQCFSNFK